ncbi:Holliday junction resolvase RuvX [Candidatus Dojkabacteria bacterium]|nr:Holliday junction resolvase RuvX [Candidatus Dojkabacteria bacterium]
MDYPILAIDFGTKRIGLAVSDALGKVANPITPIRVTKNSNEDSLLTEFKLKISEHGIKSILIGMPQEFEESHKQNTVRITKFIEWLTFHIPLPYKTWDESFSTSRAQDMIVSAGRRVKSRKNMLDSISASIFLQEFLNSNKD